MKRSLLAVCLLLACDGAPPPRCTVSTDCTGGQICQAGACVDDPNAACTDSSNPGVPNLAPNPGFECGVPPDGWAEPLFGTLGQSQNPHGGSKAVRLTAKSATSADVLLYTQNGVIGNPGVKNLCGSAWIRGTGDGVVNLKRVGSNLDEKFYQPLQASWDRINTWALTSSADSSVSFGVGLAKGQRANIALTDWIEIDDAQVWVSTQADGGCTQR